MSLLYFLVFSSFFYPFPLPCFLLLLHMPIRFLDNILSFFCFDSWSSFPCYILPFCIVLLLVLALVFCSNFIAFSLHLFFSSPTSVSSRIISPGIFIPIARICPERLPTFPSPPSHKSSLSKKLCNHHFLLPLFAFPFIVSLNCVS